MVPLLLAGTGVLGFAVACHNPQPCATCGTIVVAAVGEPSSLLPPLVGETVGRDVSDLIFERLAVLPGPGEGPGASPLDSSAYRPGLAVAWERVDSVTLRFHLRPGAKWQDGVPVNARDVVFSFQAYADTGLQAQAQELLAGRVTATAADDSTVLIRFREPDPEQWYDATWHVRILPRHLWDSTPPSRWTGERLPSLVGSGPFRLVRWDRGQSLILERVAESPRDAVRRIAWRFTEDPEAALNLLLSHEADLLEAIGDSSRMARVDGDPRLSHIAYPSAVYGFLGFNLGGRAALLHDRTVRRALAMTLDRSASAQGAIGAGAVAPPGPMSRVLWLYDDSITVARHDSAAAARLLDSLGWRRGQDGVRRRAGTALALDVLVPSTSSARRNLAQIVQEAWRRAGISATVTSVDFPVFQERLRKGRFDSFIGAWLDEPSPRGLGPQWTGAGIGQLNYCRYRNPVFDSLFRRAAGLRAKPAEVKLAWRETFDTLNADTPAIWLYTPTNLAGVSKRITSFSIDPYSWLATLTGWRMRDSP